MAKFTISTTISKPLDIVWNAFKDPENMLNWTKYLERVETVKGEFGEIGAVAHLHYLEKGRSYMLEDKLVSYEEKKRIESQVSGRGMFINVKTVFDSSSDQTTITMTWNGMSPSFLTRLILRLMQKKISKQALAELNDFKKLVEKYGEKFI